MKLLLAIILISLPALAAEVATELTVGVVQMSRAKQFLENRDRIIAGISKVAAGAAEVAVFPEAALAGDGSENPESVREAIEKIQAAARQHKIHVLFGGASRSEKGGKEKNWMYALGPAGQVLFHYDKIFDNHNAPLPGVFQIQGIPCSAFLCADRWLRGLEEIPIQQGAKISFELSCNFASEWIPAYEWYWQVPRALRNNTWVIVANTGNRISGVSDDPTDPRELRHGHSAIISPAGQIAAASTNDVETIIFAKLNLAEATRAEALARSAHPALRSFWDLGKRLYDGQKTPAPSIAPMSSVETSITLAAAQAVHDLPAMIEMVARARSRNADLVAFPERSATEADLPELQKAAKEHRITIVAGLERRLNGALRNSACVIGPDGVVLTEYDQLSARSPYQAGADAGAMWFRVKNVPAIVTIGHDSVWSELAELGAVAGAQIHVHLANETDPANEMRRLQLWANLASFHTFTVTANAAGSAIWDDLRDLEERRAEVDGLPHPDTGKVEVYSPFSANIITRAGSGAQLITATRRVNKTNPHYPRRTARMNPQMDAWYRLGAKLISAHPAALGEDGSAQSKPKNNFKGRIAYSADGNHNDPDDWIASPMALAIFAEAGLKSRLVHFDYNCILPQTNPEWEKKHEAGVLGAADRYGFDRGLFFDCQKKLDAAISSLAQAIDDSSADNPLYLVIAGPVEVPYRAIAKSNPAKRRFVYCISHSRWNDGFASNYNFTFTKRSVIEQGIHWVQIRDQNRLLSLSPYKRPAKPEEFAGFFWMRDSKDPNIQFLWDRMLVSTRPDPSDAGMAYFVGTGDEDCDPAKLKGLLEQHEAPEPIAERKLIRIEAENFQVLNGFALEDRKEKTASHQLSIAAEGKAAEARSELREPFMAQSGRYDVLVRHRELREPCKWTLFINDVPQGQSWTTTNAAWASQVIPGVSIRSGDEMRVAVEGAGARLDYVELKFLGSDSTRERSQ